VFGPYIDLFILIVWSSHPSLFSVFDAVWLKTVDMFTQNCYNKIIDSER